MGFGVYSKVHMNLKRKSQLKRAASARKRNGTRAAKSRLAVVDRGMARAQRKSVEELAAAQGVKLTRLDDILGKGAGLWDGDLELERFVEDIYALRKEDRELAKR